MNEEQRFVAKRFFKLSEDSENDGDKDSTVSVTDHEVQIQAELAQLVLGRMFLKEFYSVAHKANVPVFESKDTPCCLLSLYTLTQYCDQVSCFLRHTLQGS